MDPIDMVRNSFNESIQIKIDSADALPEHILAAGNMLTQTLIAGKKVLVCGSGNYSALTQIFTTHLMHQLTRERPSLPVISLSDNLALFSAISNETGSNEVFARQVRALGDESDILLTLSADGNCFACAQAIRAALSRDMYIISLTGDDGGEITGLTGPEDIEIRIPSNDPQRILEVQLMIINCLAHLVDINLFGEIGS